MGRSTSTMPWSKSMNIARSAITHCSPIEIRWYAEIVASWPITVFFPISTSPSWQRILVRSPTHTNRPNLTVPRLEI